MPDYTLTLADKESAYVDAEAARKQVTPEELLAAAIKQLVVQERWPIRVLI